MLSQGGPQLEVIVVDDFPERSAYDVVTGIGDCRIRYEPNPNPSGGWVSAVRNHGVALATGALVHFLDDDDQAPPGHYAAMTAAFEANPNVGVIFGRVEPFGDNPKALDTNGSYSTLPRGAPPLLGGSAANGHSLHGCFSVIRFLFVARP